MVTPIRSIAKAYLDFRYKKVLVKDKKGKKKMMPVDSVQIGDKVYKTLRFNFSSSDPSLSKDKKLNTEIWYEEDTFLWVKAAFDKTGYWEYRLKKVK